MTEIKITSTPACEESIIICEKGAFRRSHGNMVFTDSNVYRIYKKEIDALALPVHVMQAGESNKNEETLFALLSAMADAGLHRKDTLLCVGGGVVGDIGGLAAALYMRGINCVQVPTTLLSQVDSSVGGKTAIDFKGIKNLVGVFRQPREVLVDAMFLRTLPEREIVCGLGEIIKHGALHEPLFDKLFSNADRLFDLTFLEEIVPQNIALKADVVQKDAHETDLRKCLNMGHTTGHALELYEKKMTTYPRTDARVLSTAVSKEIDKNLRGLTNWEMVRQFAADILNNGSYKKIVKTRYVNDKQITDHYAIIPTGQGLNNLNHLNPTTAKVYEIIVRRFLSIFLPPAVYRKISLRFSIKGEQFFAGTKVLEEEGYLKAAAFSFSGAGNAKPEAETSDENASGRAFLEAITHLKKGMTLPVKEMQIKEGETTPPKRYNSGTMILAMENAGQFIEDEELRSQIKGSGIGTSATRAEILKKLINIEYLALNKKTQALTPTLLGEMIYDVVNSAIRPLLDPALTASWEKGLTMVADGTITGDEYMKKLDDFVSRRTNIVKGLNNQFALNRQFNMAAENYKK